MHGRMQWPLRGSPCPPQQQEEGIPWEFLYTCDEEDMLKLLQREVERAAARNAEKDKCESEQALSNALTILGPLESRECTTEQVLPEV